MRDVLLIVPDCGDVEDCHAETERLLGDHQHRGSSLEAALRRSSPTKRYIDRVHVYVN